MSNYITPAGSRPVFRVFYAWQSDTPAKWNRRLIGEALQQVADELGQDPGLGVAIEIDQDTRGVTGWCDIPATILDKIRACDCAVFDLTFIAETTREHLCVRPEDEWSPKRCSNPNVLFELGYAAHSLGPERLVCVANSTFGEAEGINFDFHHRRHPIPFALNDAAGTKSEVLKQLVKDLRAAIGDIVREWGLRETVDVDKSSKVFGQELNTARQACCKVDKEDDASSCPRWTFAIYPLSHSGERWREIEHLRSVIENATDSRAGNMRLNPQMSRGMGWGIAGGSISEYAPWGMTFTGLFCCCPRLNPYRNSFADLVPNKCFSACEALLSIRRFFAVASKLSQAYLPTRDAQIEISVNTLDGVQLVLDQNHLNRCSEPASDDNFYFPTPLPVIGAEIVAEGVMMDCCKRFCDIFTIEAGATLTREQIKHLLYQLPNP